MHSGCQNIIRFDEIYRFLADGLLSVVLFVFLTNYPIYLYTDRAIITFDPKLSAFSTFDVENFIVDIIQAKCSSVRM